MASSAADLANAGRTPTCATRFEQLRVLVQPWMMDLSLEG
jgi:hypothetical protein